MATYTTTALANEYDFDLVELTSPNKTGISVSSPPEFKGRDDQWSPEDLFSSSISTCFLMTFNALSKFKKMPWVSIEVTADAKLEKTADGFRFTHVLITPKLKLAKGTKVDPYIKLLEKSKETCLVTKSMNCEFELQPKIRL